MYLKRLVRMLAMYLAGEITLGSFRQSLRPAQVCVLHVGGGMVFCDSATEDMFFGN
jgi:hypothetical protein